MVVTFVNRLSATIGQDCLQGGGGAKCSSVKSESWYG